MSTFLDRLSPPPVAHTWQPVGHALTIRAMPDAFTREVLNIGVAMVLNNGTRIAKVVDEPGRLSCLYGEQQSHAILLMAKIAYEAFLSGESSPSPTIIFSEPTPVFHMTPENALESLFKDQVTVAIPQRAAQGDSEEGALPTDTLRAQVYGYIRDNTEPMIGDTIIPQSTLAVVNTAKGPRTVRVPLQPPTGLGALESADYSGQTVRIHLMDALLDVEFAAEARNIKRLGLFIARPSRPGVSDRQLREIDNAIDNVTGRAPRNCRVEVETKVERLAEHILDWSELRAA
jgi:hypothetical protein